MISQYFKLSSWSVSYILNLYAGNQAIPSYSSNQLSALCRSCYGLDTITFWSGEQRACIYLRLPHFMDSIDVFAAISRCSSMSFVFLKNTDSHQTSQWLYCCKTCIFFIWVCIHFSLYTSIKRWALLNYGVIFMSSVLFW